MPGNLRPNSNERVANIGIGVFRWIKRMIIEDEMKLQFLSYIDDLIKKIIKQRIDGIIGRAGGHGVQVDRQSNNITAQTFDVVKILPGKFSKLNLPRAWGLKPIGEINAAMKRDRKSV